MITVARKAREKTLPDVTLADGDLRIAPLRKNTQESAEALAEKAYGLMPHVKITELLAEVGQWTSLGDRFWHLRTQAPAKNRQALLTAILADGINLGSRACPEISERDRSNIGTVASVTLHFCLLFYTIMLYAHRDSRASRLRVRVFTTAFPEWSTVNSFSRPPATVPQRPKDFSY